MSNDTIPPEIQAWISRDTFYLNNCTLPQFNSYKQWFYDPATPIEPNWFAAIEQVIQNLEGTKQ